MPALRLAAPAASLVVLHAPRRFRLTARPLAAHRRAHAAMAASADPSTLEARRVACLEKLWLT
jgi:hypothetical protein